MYHRSLFLRAKKFFLPHSAWINTLVIFCVSILLYTWLNSTATFVDPDSFYHIKMTELIMQRRDVIVIFPWLPFTTLANAFVDHHMLYHLVLIPFFLLLGSVAGMKVATVLLAASAVTIFFSCLRALHVRWPLLWAMLLLAAEPFSFRMALAKAPSVGAIFLFAGLFFLCTQRYRFLALLGFFFVWAYGGFLLLVILVGLFTIVNMWSAIAHSTSLRPSLAPLLLVLGGTIAGLLIHPSFPKNLDFYWQQIIHIGFVNYHSAIGVGSEWYPLSLADIILNAPLVSLVFGSGIVFFLATARRQTVFSKTLFGMALLFFFFTLKSQRYVEYYVPWVILFSASAWQDSGVLAWCRLFIVRRAKKFFQLSFAQRVLTGMVSLYIAVIIPGLLLQQLLHLGKDLHGGIPVTRYENAGVWLRGHATKGDIVFHNDWDDFPILFYQSAKLRFIAGLDPTFFYRRDPDKYWQWVHITTGVQSDHLLEILQQEFNARFVVVDRDHQRLRDNMVADGRMKIVYEDLEVTIFRVPRL